MQLNPTRWPLKAKFISILLLVLLIPVSAVFVLKEVEKALVDSLKQNLMLTSSLVSQQLGQNGNWFENSYLPQSSEFIAADLFVFPLDQQVVLDGHFDEWFELEKFRKAFRLNNSSTSSDRLEVLLGESEESLMLSVIVYDEKIIYPDVQVDKFQSDQIVINFFDQQDQLQRIYIKPQAPGKIPVKKLVADQAKIDWRYSAVWNETSHGFNFELKFPRGIKPKQLNLVHYDVDQKSQIKVKSIIATHQFELSPVVWPSKSISDFVNDLPVSPGQRLWVLDRDGRALARKDNLQKLELQLDSNPLINWLLSSQASQLVDKRASQMRLDSTVIFDALKGESSAVLESAGQGKHSVISAGAPIRTNSDILGVVFIEENVAKVQLLQQKTLARMVYFSGIIVSFILLILIWYVSRISLRIGRLKKQINRVVDEQGRMNSPLVLEEKEGDEIDELSNAFLHMGTKLYDYNDYLEKLASRLSHELRTPIAIVRSSLDNLLLTSDKEQHVAIERAIEGVERLGEIISRMRRATGIKQAMQSAELEKIDLVAMLKMLVDGFQSSFSDYQFKFESNLESYPKDISGDLIAEMLDKLISNAMDFSEKDSVISVCLIHNEKELQLSVINKGPTIPKKNIKKIFQSLVSIRENKTKEGANLGLGLYVVKLISEFHGARVKAENLADGSGVKFNVLWNNLESNQ